MFIYYNDLCWKRSVGSAGWNVGSSGLDHGLCKVNSSVSYCTFTFRVFLKQCLNTAWCRYIVKALAHRELNGRVTRRGEFTGQEGSQLSFYGKIYTLCNFTSGGEDGLTLCWTEWNRIFFSFSLFLSPPNSYENPASRTFDICFTPEGNMGAQCARQLILTMSSALGRRMKLRFDLIGYEKVSHLGPAGKEEGYRGNRFAHARTNAKSFDLSLWLSSFPVWVHVWVSRINTLILQLITGINTRGKALRWQLWLALCSLPFIVVCVYLCIWVKNPMFIEG